MLFCFSFIGRAKQKSCYHQNSFERTCFAFRSREICIRCVRVLSFTVERSLHHLPPSDRLGRESWPLILFHSSPSNNLESFDRFFNR